MSANYMKLCLVSRVICLSVKNLVVETPSDCTRFAIYCNSYLYVGCTSQYFNTSPCISLMSIREFLSISISFINYMTSSRDKLGNHRPICLVNAPILILPDLSVSIRLKRSRILSPPFDSIFCTIRLVSGL